MSHSRGLAVGHGVDVIDITEIATVIGMDNGSQLARQFTQQELADAGSGVRQIERLAGRLAIKEAVMKALHLGWGDGVAFTDVEVLNLPSGEPKILLHRQLAQIQKEFGITGWLISISHSKTVAIGSVIALA